MHKSIQEYLTASEVVRAIKNACEETLMSLDELDEFVTKIENLRKSEIKSDNCDWGSTKFYGMERSKLASKMADAIIDVETKLLSPRESITQAKANNKDSSKQRQLRQKYVGKSKRLLDMFVTIEHSPLNRIFIGAEEAILDFLVDCMVGDDYTVPRMIDIASRVATYGRPLGKADLDMVETNVRDLYTGRLPKRDGAGTMLHEAAKLGKLHACIRTHNIYI